VHNLGDNVEICAFYATYMLPNKHSMYLHLSSVGSCRTFMVKVLPYRRPENGIHICLDKDSSNPMCLHTSCIERFVAYGENAMTAEVVRMLICRGGSSCALQFTIALTSLILSSSDVFVVSVVLA
jgi:hypothetical protein